MKFPEILEGSAQSGALSAVTADCWGDARQDRLPHAVAVGVAAAEHVIPVEMAFEMFLHAFVLNLISAGVRLIPFGHTVGQ